MCIKTLEDIALCPSYASKANLENGLLPSDGGGEEDPASCRARTRPLHGGGDTSPCPVKHRLNLK